jgi:hypothetical protein
VVTILLLLSFIVVAFALQALSLWVGARLAKVPGITLWRALITCVATYFASLALFAGVIGLVSSGIIPPLVGALLEMLAGLVLTWALIAWLFRSSFGKAILAWLPSLLALGVTGALAFLVLRGRLEY